MGNPKKQATCFCNCFRQRDPPLKIGNLIDDLKDGTRLLALLEILSGERLPVERGRILRRPHYLSNCNTALEFLRTKRVSKHGRRSRFLVEIPLNSKFPPNFNPDTFHTPF